MRIEYVEGDLIASAEPVLAHGCNAMGAFASGFAAAVRAAMPSVHAAYARAHAEGRLRPGALVWGRHGTRAVANCITQPTYGRTGLHLDYRALRECMRALNAAGRDGAPDAGLPEGFARIAMPTIGADRGGGDWGEISRIIEDEMTHVTPAVYHLRGSRFRPPQAMLPGF